MNLLKNILPLIFLFVATTVAEKLATPVLKHPTPLQRACKRLSMNLDKNHPTPIYQASACFEPVSISKTYKEASESCGTLQCGHLVYLANRAEMKRFGELMKKWGYDNCTSVWSALNIPEGDVSMEFGYTLAEYEMHYPAAQSKIPWHPGQPNKDLKKFSVGSFAISAKKTGKWRMGYVNEPRDKKNYFVCMYESPGHNNCPY